MRDGGLIEEIARIKVAVAQEFKYRPVPIVCPGLGDNGDLAAGPFAVLRAVSVAQQVEFPNRVHPQQLLAGTAGLHIVLGGAREFDPVQQEEVLLRPVPRDREHVADGRVGNSDPACLLPREVDDPGIQGKKLIVASAVQRQVLYLPLSDQTRRSQSAWR